MSVMEGRLCALSASVPPLVEVGEKGGLGGAAPLYHEHLARVAVTRRRAIGARPEHGPLVLFPCTSKKGFNP